MDLLLLESSSLKIWYLLNKNKANRSCNIHEINKTRHIHGEFHHLYSQLREHPEKFKSYFRMSISTFDYILEGIKLKLLKKWTNCNQNPINPNERLAVTLRYLAMGLSFKSLGFTFRMGASTVSLIVRETVEAIWISGRLNIPPDDVLPSTAIIVPHVFIGDEAYPLLKNLLKPFNRRNLDANKEYFNMRLSRARRVVECAFGIINAKFRILWKPIELPPEWVDKVVKCICVLHNIIVDKEGVDIQNENLISISHNIDGSRQNNRSTDTANFVRETYKIVHFHGYSIPQFIQNIAIMVLSVFLVPQGIFDKNTTN
ncbi:hypothetical protein NQ315_004420 [Exocentrus adspersus]|uniref:DDE Tnp4 domain-containing protein n=1 Tax=Exocentrus adspersus TaxID=1586481 RepID=A0AAV8VAA0_9CUCU|nr:hypothetical protein NQ315_004420 [Exocentrus adspersus]